MAAIAVMMHRAGSNMVPSSTSALGRLVCIETPELKYIMASIYNHVSTPKIMKLSLILGISGILFYTGSIVFCILVPTHNQPPPMPGTTSNRTTTKKSQQSYKILIADDHDIFRHGLRALLNKYPFINCKGEASNGKELKKLVSYDPPDMIFMDLHMPGGHGAQTTVEILREYPQVKIIILSLYNDALTVERMMKTGAFAYLTKSINIKILDAMFEKVLNNVPYICPEAATNLVTHKILPNISPTMPEQTQWLAEEITVREKQVLAMTTQGMSQKEMADKLHLSTRTIETHKEKLMRKLGAKNKAELISIAHEYKLL